MYCLAAAHPRSIWPVVGIQCRTHHSAVLSRPLSPTTTHIKLPNNIVEFGRLSLASQIYAHPVLLCLLFVMRRFAVRQGLARRGIVMHLASRLDC